MPYIDPSVIAQVKQIDLLTYLQQREPSELVKIGPCAYATKTHDSLKISNGKWYWWSRGFGGRTALDYLIKVRDMKFTDAVNCLSGHLSAPVSKPTRDTAPEPKRLLLPPKHDNPSKVVSYLESRGIAHSVIEHCIDAGTVYESRRGNLSNAVFLGRDARGIPRYAAIRGCKGRYRGEAEGSDKRYSFRLANYPLNLVTHVFESSIDALSYATMLEMRGRDWRRENLISLGGVPPVSARPGKESIPAALAQYLADNPDTEALRLHLDNDGAGLNAAALISTLLSARYEVCIEPPGFGKDVNDELMALTGRTTPEAKRRVR
ncbi:DUF3991 domain-containing protein [Eggerthella timonensis]|uniref:DUF3991 domain-containing protein n=1 Tax=Eggerthella timonensis TaxID=1871008 RepID=UPI000C77FC23|nr:DUF3991 domain-containing protein [Eggerthella timonensis]